MRRRRRNRKRLWRGLASDAYEIGIEITVNGTPCWLWQRSLDKDGYGQIRIGEKIHRAHKAMYEKWRDPVEGDLVLDHLCRNRACVNPWHLEAITQGENVRRGDAAKPRKTENDE